ncbi:unnamed protein product [Boreogadus saida]
MSLSKGTSDPDLLPIRWSSCTARQRRPGVKQRVAERGVNAKQIPAKRSDWADGTELVRPAGIFRSARRRTPPGQHATRAAAHSERRTDDNNRGTTEEGLPDHRPQTAPPVPGRASGALGKLSLSAAAPSTASERPPPAPRGNHGAIISSFQNTQTH